MKVDHLISAQLSQTLDEEFDRMTENSVSEKKVQNIVRAFFVIEDLKTGFDINYLQKIPRNELTEYLTGYLKKNPKDHSVNKLYEILNKN